MGQVVPPRAVQWAFDIHFELRTVVAAGVGIYLAGRILPLEYELRFCIIIIIRTISAFCIVLLCVLYVMYMYEYSSYVSLLFLCILFHSTVYHAILVSGIKDTMLKPAAASNNSVRYSN